MTTTNLVQTGGIATTLAAASVIVDRMLASRREDRKLGAEEDQARAAQVAVLIDQAVALAAEHREGEHDCRAELAAMRTELDALRAQVVECERKHGETARLLADLTSPR